MPQAVRATKARRWHMHSTRDSNVGTFLLLLLWTYCTSDTRANGTLPSKRRRKGQGRSKIEGHQGVSGGSRDTHGPDSTTRHQRLIGAVNIDFSSHVLFFESSAAFLLAAPAATRGKAIEIATNKLRDTMHAPSLSAWALIKGRKFSSTKPLWQVPVVERPARHAQHQLQPGARVLRF